MTVSEILVAFYWDQRVRSLFSAFVPSTFIWQNMLIEMFLVHILWSAFCCFLCGQKIFEQGRNFCLCFCPLGRSPKTSSSNPAWDFKAWNYWRKKFCQIFLVCKSCGTHTRKWVKSTKLCEFHVISQVDLLFSFFWVEILFVSSHRNAVARNGKNAKSV